LNRIIEDIIDEFNEEINLDNLGEVSKKTMVRNMVKAFGTLGLNKTILMALQANPDTFLENLKKLIENHPGLGNKEYDFKTAIRSTIELKNKKGTEFDEFNLGKRARKSKGAHPVLVFCEDVKKGLDDNKLVVKATQPIKNVFKLVQQY